MAPVAANISAIAYAAMMAASGMNFIKIITSTMMPKPPNSLMYASFSPTFLFMMIVFR